MLLDDAPLDAAVALYGEALTAARTSDGRLQPQAEQRAWEAACAAAGGDPAKAPADRTPAEWELARRLQQAIARDTEERRAWWR